MISPACYQKVTVDEILFYIFIQKWLEENDLKQKDKVFVILYKEYYPVIQKLVLQNKGTMDDAQDIFQDGFIGKEYFVYGEDIRFYPNSPKLPDLEVISLSLSAEAVQIDSENLLLYLKPGLSFQKGLEQ